MDFARIERLSKRINKAVTSLHRLKVDWRPQPTIDPLSPDTYSDNVDSIVSGYIRDDVLSGDDQERYARSSDAYLAASWGSVDKYKQTRDFFKTHYTQGERDISLLDFVERHFFVPTERDKRLALRDGDTDVYKPEKLYKQFQDEDIDEAANKTLQLKHHIEQFRNSLEYTQKACNQAKVFLKSEFGGFDALKVTKAQYDGTIESISGRFADYMADRGSNDPVLQRHMIDALKASLLLDVPQKKTNEPRKGKRKKAAEDSGYYNAIIAPVMEGYFDAISRNLRTNIDACASIEAACARTYQEIRAARDEYKDPSPPSPPVSPVPG